VVGRVQKKVEPPSLPSSYLSVVGRVQKRVEPPSLPLLQILLLQLFFPPELRVKQSFIRVWKSVDRNKKIFKMQKIKGETHELNYFLAGL
jgi:hypothetical protein